MQPDIETPAAVTPELQAALDWIAGEYRQCIVAARCTVDGYYYERVAGRAEAYRQASDHVTAALGIPPTDWDGIKEAVPADGIYRTQEAAND